MFHDPETRHPRQPRRKLAQGLAILCKQTIQQQPPARVREGLEHVILGITTATQLRRRVPSRSRRRRRQVIHWSPVYPLTSGHPVQDPRGPTPLARKSTLKNEGIDPR